MTVVVLFNAGLGDKGIHSFLKGISLKGNAIEWIEFELTYYEFTVLHINHCTMRISS